MTIVIEENLRRSSRNRDDINYAENIQLIRHTYRMGPNPNVRPRADENEDEPPRQRQRLDNQNEPAYNAFEVLENLDLDGVVLRTRSIMTGTPETFDSFRRKFPSTMEDTRIVCVRSMFDILQAQCCSGYYNLMSNDDLTVQVYFELGAVRMWRADHHNSIPEGTEWRANIPLFKTEIVGDNLDEAIRTKFNPLFIPIISTEVNHRGNLFALQHNIDLEENPHETKHFMSEMGTLVDNWNRFSSIEKRIFQKLIISAHVREINEAIDTGFPTCDQSIFIEYCFESLKKMFNGSFICQTCMLSWKDKNGLISHCRRAHKDSIDVAIRINQENARRDGERQLEQQIAEQTQTIAALQQELATLRENIGFNHAPRRRTQ